MGKSSEENSPKRTYSETIFKVLDNYLVGKKSSDPRMYSSKWHQKFSHRPTWCDADMTLQQINRGEATGKRIPLYVRSLLQGLLFDLGSFVQNWAYTVIIVGVLIFSTSTIGLRNVAIEADLVKLWVSRGGRLDDELRYLSMVKRESRKALEEAWLMTKSANATTNVSSSLHVHEDPNDVAGGFQLVIQTPKKSGANVLTKEDLLIHAAVVEEISKFTVLLFGVNWTLSDICFKPPAPADLNGFISYFVNRIVPCIWITPLDCFWEGSKPLGPNPPLVLGPNIEAFLVEMPKGEVTWKNLNAAAVISEVGSLFDTGTIENFFERAGVGMAYLDRWCIDPLDVECPSKAPNAFDHCSALKKFQVWNSRKPMDEQINLRAEIAPEVNQYESSEGTIVFQKFFVNKKQKREASSEEFNVTDDYNVLMNDDDYEAKVFGKKEKKKEETEGEKCRKYSKSFARWMKENGHRWGEFLTEDEMPVFPNYGDVVKDGCYGFGRKTMRWPAGLIIGGIKRKSHKVISAEALQSIFLVATSYDVYTRFRDGKIQTKENLDLSRWTPEMAQEVINTWQRNFTKRLYDHPLNKNGHTRQLHPLASTSITDILLEFSQFNFTAIAVGYLLMFLYAGWSQLKLDGYWFAVDSSVGLGFIGVLLVTLSSASGLGLCTWLGIKFNVSTTQIVPFISLGLGIDDMFLLLHNYNEIIRTVKANLIGVLMKETGMSILITSTNTIIAFLAGTLLPVPALRSFCCQLAVMLFSNLVALMVLYPAFIALDLRRRRSQQRDLCCCCSAKNSKIRAAEASKGAEGNLSRKSPTAHRGSVNFLGAYSTSASDYDEATEAHKWYTLRGFLFLYYIPFLRLQHTKRVIIVLSFLMCLLGLAGLKQLTLGLELSDVLPEESPPAAFFRARERYFSFYPMFAAVNGSNVDYPYSQHLIEQLRVDLGKSRYIVIADGRPSEQYWLSLMRNWLRSIQEHLDIALSDGIIDKNTGEIVDGAKLTNEAKIGLRLACSYGNTYNCSGRLGKFRFVSKTETIDPNAFYNYLTGWYNADSMMYYISQASFYPEPPKWLYTQKELLVPPAKPLAYSQIPFYLNNLVDTPAIVAMIDEIRGICESYKNRGLPTFPVGIVFTFWEQYMQLRLNLLLAISVIGTSVFFVISLLIFNTWAAAIVTLIVISMSVELCGFMGFVGVKMNAVSAVILISAVGIGVEFTAHVMLAFLTSLGTNDERMASCLEHMFIPVIHGGFSTLLGIAMLAFSEFDFVVKYFFVVMTALVIIGLLNGLAVLPALLSFVGPSCEVEPADKSNSLCVPSSLSGSCEEYSRSAPGSSRTRNDIGMEYRRNLHHLADHRGVS